MLTTWFLASNELVADRFRLRVARDVRDPSTGGVMTATGPVWETLSDLPYFQIDGLDLETVALLFDLEALEEIDRTRSTGGTAEGRRAFEAGLPALFRVPAEAVAAFQGALSNRKQRARSFGERARAKGLRVGVDIGASPRYLERSGAWRGEILPDTETELFEAFATLLEDAEPGVSIVAVAEET
jgi:hypothetical protein